jgi:hypothetical protein
MLLITPVASSAGTSGELAMQLARQLESIRKDASVVQFFDTHAWLLDDPRYQAEATLRLSRAEKRLAVTKRRAAQTRRVLAARKAAERRQLLARQAAAEQAKLERELNASPQKAICHVFGGHCKQALAVARCESRLSTTAQNGQYLGLFQMGSSERRIFGHGPTPLEQARAAHRYFVRSGRDWSPWSCKPWW